MKPLLKTILKTIPFVVDILTNLEVGFAILRIIILIAFLKGALSIEDIKQFFLLL